MEIRRDNVKQSSRVRSAVSNGNKPFADGDGRGAWARRWRDLCELHVADLGGPDNLSQAQISMCKRCSTLEVELEKMEGQLSMGETVDLDLFNRISGNLRRLLETIGIERKARDVTPSLHDYLAAKRQASALEAAE